jgi:hypothetical protein
LLTQALKTISCRILEKLQKILFDGQRWGARLKGLSANNPLNPVWHLHDEWLLSDAKKATSSDGKPPFMLGLRWLIARRKLQVVSYITSFLGNLDRMVY